MFLCALFAFQNYSRSAYIEFCSQFDSVIKRQMKNGAASVIRTRDLTLTKGALYRWSYSSTWRSEYIKTLIDASKHYAEKPAE